MSNDTGHHSLPELPDEAVTAVLRTFMDPDHPAADAERTWAKDDLAAAWPYLYAAALRHAAYVVAIGWGGGSITSGRLHEMADEAIRSTGTPLA